MKTINFLKKIEEILGKKRFIDADFETKAAIFNEILRSGLPYTVGINNNYTYLTVRDKGVSIRFYSHGRYPNEVEIGYTLDVMSIEVNGKEATISKAIKYLEKIKPMPLGILNTSILTSAGEYKLKDISLGEAKQLVSDNALDSAVGHTSTAEVMTTLLRVEIPVNRQQFVQQPGQQALVFKLNGRPEEGKILSVEEIERIGYKFQLLTRET